jgi:hypothetical protein
MEETKREIEDAVRSSPCFYCTCVIEAALEAHRPSTYAVHCPNVHPPGPQLAAYIPEPDHPGKSNHPFS